jgi:phosphohistidine swiveling domain-containing protein
VPGEGWDVLHDPGPADSHWSTDNVGEAAPGVLSPLSWSMWGATGDRMPRVVAYRMGIFSAADRRRFPPIVRPFYGRIALRMEYLATMGDRMPGVDGADLVANMFGRVPETMIFAPTRRRYPVIAFKLPRAMIVAPGEVRRRARVIDAWWRSTIPTISWLTRSETVSTLRDAVQRFDESLTWHSLALLAVVQPLLVELTKLVERAGVGDVGALSGTGGAEMAIISDIWLASRGVLTIGDVVASHGFHGPFEGEVSSRVWREDPAPLERMIRSYADRPDAEDPVQRERVARERLPELQRLLLAALPVTQRPMARLVLTFAERLLPLRGVGKRAFLQSLDVARGAARRLGEHLVAEGRLISAGDVFQLTVDELTDVLPADAADLAQLRRERGREYEAIRLPGNWRGRPDPTAIAADPRRAGGSMTGAIEVISGLGVSAGVVEGRVRVVVDPSFAEVEPGEVLVTSTTDPSWASIMFLSSALIVDIGGPLSHAAVVARELGVPCVVNTRTASSVLHTGDLVRVDGNTGSVEVLDRVENNQFGHVVQESSSREVKP